MLGQITDTVESRFNGSQGTNNIYRPNSVIAIMRHQKNSLKGLKVYVFAIGGFLLLLDPL